MSMTKPLRGRLPIWGSTWFPQPVLLMPFYEGDGAIVNDLSGNGRNGTLAAGITWSQGQFGPVLSGSGGATGYVDTNWRWTFGTGAFTLSCWYKGTEATNYAGLVGAAITNSIGCAMLIYNGHIAVWLNNEMDEGSITINDDVWHHCAFTRNGTVGRLYVDGVQDGVNKVVLGSSVDVAQNVWIFGWGNSSYTTKGLIDLPMILDRDLPAQQIAYLYRNPFPWFIEDEVSHLYLPPTGISMPLLMQQMNHFNGGMAA